MRRDSTVASDWHGDDGMPKFGRKARAWFALHIRLKLEERPEPGPGRDARCEVTSEEVGPVVDWICADPIRYVTYKPSDEYHGRGYSNGSWTIEWEGVFRAIPHALNDIRGLTINSLDEWLSEDIADNLTGRIEGGSGLIPRKQRRELAVLAHARRMKIPRVCVQCGAEFKRTRSARRCPPCVERRKEAVAPAKRGGRGVA